MTKSSLDGGKTYKYFTFPIYGVVLFKLAIQSRAFTVAILREWTVCSKDAQIKKQICQHFCQIALIKSCLNIKFKSKISQLICCAQNEQFHNEKCSLFCWIICTNNGYDIDFGTVLGQTYRYFCGDESLFLPAAKKWIKSVVESVESEWESANLTEPLSRH